MTSELTYGTLFYEHLLVKDIGLEFLISKINFEKALLGPFPYRPYVYHKNDSTYLTQKI